MTVDATDLLSSRLFMVSSPERRGEPLPGEVEPSRKVYVPPHPMTFESFLDSYGKDDEVELIDGVVYERTPAELTHERLRLLMMSLVALSTEDDGGIVLGPCTAVRVNDFRGRLPDLLFVSKENLSIVQKRAIYGAPDLILEIVSEWDRPSDLRALESDYRNLGVAEIGFIDPQKRTVRFLRKDAVATGGYADTTIETGPVSFATLPGLSFDVAYLWSDPLPKPSVVLASLFAAKPSA